VSLPQRHGVRWHDANDGPRCPSFEDGDGVQCSYRANPAHVWHVGSGLAVVIDEFGMPDLESFAVSWRDQ
jgi:hypothetical protein